MERFDNYALGTGIGYISYVGAKKIGNNIKKPYGKFVLNKLVDFTQEENKILKQSTFDAFNISGLKSKKYYLHNVNLDNVNLMEKLMRRKSAAIAKRSKFIQKLDKLKKNKRRPLTIEETKELSKRIDQYLKNKEYKKVWHEFKNACKGKPILTSSEAGKILKSDKKNKLATKLKIVAEGKNAFCSPFTKDIMINTDKMAAASFHEMGHALNASGGKLIKSLAIGRHVSALFVPIILAVGLLKPHKSEGQEPKNIIDKTTTFIKNNAGKLTFAALLPTLVEEGLASIRGGQLAKQVLNPNLLKKVNKANFLAWTTYVAGALVISGATALAVKIRDKIASK